MHGRDALVREVLISQKSAKTACNPNQEHEQTHPILIFSAINAKTLSRTCICKKSKIPFLKQRLKKNIYFFFQSSPRTSPNHMWPRKGSPDRTGPPDYSPNSTENGIFIISRSLPQPRPPEIMVKFLKN